MARKSMFRHILDSVTQPSFERPDPVKLPKPTIKPKPSGLFADFFGGGNSERAIKQEKPVELAPNQSRRATRIKPRTRRNLSRRSSYSRYRGRK